MSFVAAILSRLEEQPERVAVAQGRIRMRRACVDGARTLTTSTRLSLAHPAAVWRASRVKFWASPFRFYCSGSLLSWAIYSYLEFQRVALYMRMATTRMRHD